ncbi:hypothetical protein KW790_01935 [Candidatus Parcubacteria bacterium]|nr:hypothetical protein [Candidatus Parcubacteria bacterium]
MNKMKFGVLVLVLLLLTSAGISGFLFYKLNHQTSAIPVADEAAVIVSEVSKVLVLPPNETPTIATVSDLTKLKSEPFFKNAEVGDRVLFYADSKKAILWRPSTKQVVEMSPVVPAPTTP